MKLTDIIALAKMGYTKADIDALMDTDISESSTAPATETVKGEEAPATIKAEEQKPTLDEEHNDDNIDYKSELDKLKNELLKTREELTKAQQSNIQQMLQTQGDNEANATSLFEAFRNM